ncbi:MAG: hypothetical protein JWM57_1234 [Phycisphaerales bacterium]|nr:hypothetical protein [Phycisphaerales bacterium]
MSDVQADPATPPADAPPADNAKEEARKAKAIKKWKRWRRIRRTLGVFVVLFIIAAVIGRIYLASWVTWYVNRTIDRNPQYKGKIASIDIHLYKGQYSINKITLSKRTGDATAPLFECERLDLAVDWNALLKRTIKAKAFIEKPRINFVAEATPGQNQTGASAGAGPWLGILRDLSPFDINSATVHNGSLHFVAPDRVPIVDVFLDQLNAEVQNLTNIQNRTNPLNATVDLTGRAMKSGQLECHVKFNPFSYQPSFQLALRLLRLDVTETNAFTEAYGAFNFERGTFDLVIELSATEGLLDGYVKPLFRHLQIVGPRDFRGGNLINGFWQALLGVVELPFQNAARDQFGTQIPVSGDFTTPKPDLLTTIGNVLRNAFIRAYLPRLEGGSTDMSGLVFKPGTALDPGQETDFKSK